MRIRATRLPKDFPVQHTVWFKRYSFINKRWEECGMFADGPGTMQAGRGARYRSIIDKWAERNGIEGYRFAPNFVIFGNEADALMCYLVFQ